MGTLQVSVEVVVEFAIAGVWEALLATAIWVPVVFESEVGVAANTSSASAYRGDSKDASTMLRAQRAIAGSCSRRMVPLSYAEARFCKSNFFNLRCRSLGG